MAGDERQPVQTSNGVLTNYLRVRWGLLKDRGQSDRHHAIDALLVASITRSMIKQLSDASRRQELWASDAPRDFAEELVDQHTGEVVTSSFQQNRKIQLPQPWPEFSQHVREYVENEVFVSRMPYRKISGVAHQETVRSAKCLDQGYALVKTPLTITVKLRRVSLKLVILFTLGLETIGQERLGLNRRFFCRVFTGTLS